MGNDSHFMDELKEGYALLFQRQWSPLVGGLLIGLLAVLIEAWLAALGHCGRNSQLGRLALLWRGFVCQTTA